MRALADSAFGGNLSALVTDFAEEARRRMAAGKYLTRHGIADVTAEEGDAVASQIDLEILAARKPRVKRRAA